MSDPITPADTVTPWYLDKAFLGVIIHIAAVVVLAALHVQLNEAAVVGLVVTLSTFIVAHKAKSGAALLALIKQKAEQSYTVQTPAPSLQEAAKALDAGVKP